MNKLGNPLPEIELHADQKQGCKRPRAGRRRSKVARRHWTIWASREEMAHVKEYLFRNRQNDPE